MEFKYKLGPKPLTAAQQYARVRTNPLCTGTGALYPGRFVWRYVTSPTPLSRLYSIRLNFRARQPPQATVEDPALRDLAGGRRLPHVYEQEPPRLCLYLPGNGEWQPWMRIDHTIVPWTALWLFYFEEWLVSDKWKGGGVHPSKRAT